MDKTPWTFCTFAAPARGYYNMSKSCVIKMDKNFWTYSKLYNILCQFHPYYNNNTKLNCEEILSRIIAVDGIEITYAIMQKKSN